MTASTPAAAEEVLARRIEQLGRTIATLEQRITLLEEENVRFAHMLRERGVEVRASSQIAVELPPPLAKPLARTAADLPPMAPGERRLFDETCGDQPVFLLVKSQSRADTGQWFRRGRVWAAAMAGQLALFVSGKTSWADRIPLQHLRQSLYNHVTGEVVLAPATGLRVDRLRMSPLDGYQLLAQIYGTKEDNHA